MKKLIELEVEIFVGEFCESGDDETYEGCSYLFIEEQDDIIRCRLFHDLPGFMEELERDVTTLNAEKCDKCLRFNRAINS
jgi:hypothetical protein